MRLPCEIAAVAELLRNDVLGYVEATAVDASQIIVRIAEPLACIRIAPLFALAAGLACAQGSLVIVDPTINGDTVTIPIHLQGNVLDGVAALDFQLSYDASVLQPVQVQLGEAAANAGKEIQARMLADGQYVVLMFGLGRSAVAQGEVARIALNKISDPQGGETPVTIANTKFATISGVEIPSQGSTTTLLFDSGSENGSGDVTGLPPSSSDGSPDPSNGANETPIARNTQPSDSKSVSTTGESRPAGATSLVDSTDAQLSMLLGARAEREAARARVDRQPSESGNNSRVSEMKVRRDTRPSRAITANRSRLPRERPDLKAVENGPATRTASSNVDETAQRDRILQPTPLGSGEPASTKNSLEMDPVTEGESARAQGIRLKAGFLAACLAAALVLFFVRRRLGP